MSEKSLTQLGNTNPTHSLSGFNVERDTSYNTFFVLLQVVVFVVFIGFVCIDSIETFSLLLLILLILLGDNVVGDVIVGSKNERDWYRLTTAFSN